MYGLGCLVPYAQFFMTVYASSYSRFFSSNPYFFVIVNGFYLTWVTAIFNLCSTAGKRFNWIFWEPFVYLAICYWDQTTMGKTEDTTVLYAYLAFFMVTVFRYFFYMHTAFTTLCSSLDIRFLHVK